MDDRPITPQLLKALARGASPVERLFFKDAATPGLRIRHEPSGLLSWSLSKRVRGGKVRQHGLGTYPETSLAEARRHAAEIAVEAAKGIDRVGDAHERAEKLDACSVGEALARYLAVKKANGVKTAGELVHHMCRHLEPYGLLTEPMAALTEHDIRRILSKKAEGDEQGRGRVMANRLYSYYRTFLRWSFEVGLIETELHLRIKKPAVKERPRKRLLTMEEVQNVYVAAGKLRAWRHRNFIRVLLLTGMRRGEINGLTLAEVKLNKGCIEIAGSRMKSGEDHVAPLSGLTRELLREAMFDMPPKDGVFGLHAMSRIKRKLDALVDIEDGWTFHDFRRAMATHLAGTKTRSDVVDRMLAHSAPGLGTSMVAGIYNVAQLLDERRDAAEKWARMVCPDYHE